MDMFPETLATFPDSKRFNLNRIWDKPELPKAEILPNSSSNDPEPILTNANAATNARNTCQEPHKSISDSGKFIHSASVSSSAAYLPITTQSSRTKRESTEDVFNKLQKIYIGHSSGSKLKNGSKMILLGLAVASELPRPAQGEASSHSTSHEERPESLTANDTKVPGSAQEIPVFDLDSLEHKDPISLVEAFAAEGKTHGAIKIKMNASYMEEHKCRLNPDSFTFKVNRLLNNPEVNEIYHRLKFYSELIKFHTRQPNENPASNGEELPTAEKFTNSPLGTATPEAAKPDAANIEESLPTGVLITKTDVSSAPLSVKSEAEGAISLEGSKPTGTKQKLPVFLTKFPMMDKRPLDLFDLFRFVIRKGGYAEVINRKLWAQVGRELGYKGKITSSLSSSLKLSYAKILYPLEVSLKEKALELTGDDELERSSLSFEQIKEGDAQDNGFVSVNETTKRSPNPEIHLSPSKKRKLNSRAPLILGSASEFRRSIHIKAAKGFLLNDPHLIDVKTPLVISQKDSSNDKKLEQYTSPTGVLAQINNYLKWLASYLSVLEDSSRLDVNSKLATTCSLRQFIEKDAKFQDFLWKHYKGRFNGTAYVAPEEMEELFWNYLWESPLESRKIENCTKISYSLSEGGIHQVGDDFASYKAQLYESANGADVPAGPESKGINFRAAAHENQARALRNLAENLNPFELSNVPFLPDSLFGAFQALDVANNDLLSLSLNISLTFSTENWKCEDHFTQLCNYHTFGKARRWYFIPEREFDKFEALLVETIRLQNSENPRVNKNYETKCWNVDSLAQFIHSNEDVTATQYECLHNSLENIISPYPEIRAKNDDPVFQRLIDLKGKGPLLNQEFLMTPEMLKQHGIEFTTTLQMPGEMIFKYPKTYSATISLGFSVCEEINFASKLWLDYGLEGEKWLQKQGLLPNILTFKLLTNIAQTLENANSNKSQFSPQAHAKFLLMYLALLESELKIRNAVRGKVKLKEITIEERNLGEAEMVTDDDLLCTGPSKVVLYSLDTNLSFGISLTTFDRLLENEGTTKILEDLTFAQLLKHPKYQFELHLSHSDEKLRSFLRSLNGYSVDFESWMAKYDEMMNSEDDMVLKNYKLLLHDGQKIYSALSGSHNVFESFCSGKYSKSEMHSEMERISEFKRQVKNLEAFVEESSIVVDQSHAILSLKHQQRIRNGGAENPEQDEDDHPENLQLLVELANKIPHLNFHTPEFEMILEYKNEIHNFDKACRSLIDLGVLPPAEINDMINLGTSFGIQIPSLKFLIRLKARMQWLETYETIVSGGDPFIGKKEIFSLPDLRNFRDRGLQVLSNGDVPKMQTIDEFLKDGDAYDASVKAYLSRNQFLNTVDLAVLDSKIIDMEDRSKMKGQDRLFVELDTYQKLIDLKGQAKRISFLQNFASNNYSLFETRQQLLDFEGCPYSFDIRAVKQSAGHSEEWLLKAESILTKVRVFKKQNKASPATKNVCNGKVAEKARLIKESTETCLSEQATDVFEISSAYSFVQELQGKEITNEELGSLRYCLCRDFEDGTMIECDQCHEWFHITCVKDISQIGKDDDTYTCPCCLVLLSYQATSEGPSHPDKLTENALLELIKEADSLHVKPMVELGLLKSLWEVVEQAKRWFSHPDIQSRLNTRDALYQMFLLRKFVGSPVHIGSVVTFLLNSLKNTDVKKVFEHDEVQVIEEKPAPTMEIEQRDQGSSDVPVQGSNLEKSQSPQPENDQSMGIPFDSDLALAQGEDQGQGQTSLEASSEIGSLNDKKEPSKEKQSLPSEEKALPNANGLVGKEGEVNGIINEETNIQSMTQVGVEDRTKAETGLVIGEDEAVETLETRATQEVKNSNEASTQEVKNSNASNVEVKNSNEASTEIKATEAASHELDGLLLLSLEKRALLEPNQEKEEKTS